MILINSDPSLSEADVRRAETLMGITLPGDLWAFYLANNGGRPEKRLFRRGDAGFLVHYFAPLINERTQDRQPWLYPSR